MRSREVPRSDWPILSDERGRLYVRTHAGDAFELDSFAFTTGGLVGVRGKSVEPADEPLPGAIRIPLDSIAVVRLRKVDRAATALLAAGITTAAVILIAETMSEYRPAAQPRPTSCPFIYSFDGSEYVLDSETYAGAVAGGLERIDIDNLDQLRPVSGRYRLILANERDETQYTDELTLLVADHPRGTRVFPDASGVPRVVGHGIPPASVRSFGNLDSLATRAGWEVAFARPQGAVRAALVITARNTPLAPFVLDRMLSLMGPDVYVWYAAMNTDSAARREVLDWIRAEGYLDVATWTSDGWKSIARLPDVGPALAKTQTVALDLGDYPGDTVLVKLESSPHLWQLESIELASDLGPAEIETIAARSARATDARDVATLLAAADGRYHVAVNGSSVAVEFRVPLARHGTARTVLARTVGHYYIAADDRGPSRLDLVQRIMADRSFAQQYFRTACAQADSLSLGHDTCGLRR